jgi:hypothetical protein
VRATLDFKLAIADWSSRAKPNLQALRDKLKYEYMPFYAFHLDVPAPPDVVAERVRVAVGQVPTFWQSMKSSWRRRDLDNLLPVQEIPDHSIWRFAGTSFGLTIKDKKVPVPSLRSR